MPELVSLSVAKSHLNISSTTNDAEIQQFLDAATELVREEARVFDPGSYTEVAYVSGGGVFLSHTPVLRVISVKSDAEVLAGWSVSPLGYLTGLRGWRSVTVNYVAGAAIPQARIRIAVLMVMARLWESQRGSSPTVLQGPGDEAPFTPGLQGILGEVRALLGRSGGLGVIV